MALSRNLQRHLLIIGLLIVVAGLIAASDTLHDRTEAIIFWTENLIAQAPLLGMLVFLLFAMLSAMVAFFSSALLAPIVLGRSVASAIIGDEKIAAWENQVSEHTRFIHVLFLQAVVPSEIPGYVLGMLRYRFLLYLAALGITELPYAVATVYLGESFLRGESAVFILVGIGAIALAAVVVQIHRRLSGQLP